MTELDKFYRSVEEFYSNFFCIKNLQKPTKDKSFKKMIEEIGELAGSEDKGFSKEKCEEEWADVLFTVFMHGINSEYDMNSAMQRVAIKNLLKLETATVINGVIVKKEDVHNATI